MAIVLIFILATSIAFPAYWNKVADASGFLPKMADSSFNLGLDLQGGASLLYDADMSSIAESERTAALEGVRDVIERRVNAFGIAEPLVQTSINDDSYRVSVELAGVFDVKKAIAMIGETPILEFKVPISSITLDPTEEQAAQIASAQEKERAEALLILERALATDDFSALASEISLDSTTKEQGGYVGFISDEHPVFDGLAKEIASKRYRTGVIDGLYESSSALHIVNYLSSKTETVPKLRHILICHNESDRCENERTKEEAFALAETVKDGLTARNFAERATEYSEDGSAESGGDLGYVTAGMMVPVFEEAGFALRDGRISDIVETEFGYHIIWRESSKRVTMYEIAHIEVPWTTLSDILVLSPWESTELSGKNVSNASVAFDPTTQMPYVVLTFDSEGGELFGQITEKQVGNVIGIFLDGEAISTPVVQSAIYGGEASITGNFTIAEAKLLVQRLNAGALPVPVNLVAEQTVGPTLGALSLEKGLNAAFGGFALVAIFMILYYRLSGLFAVLSLFVYASINLAIYKLLGVTITLSGIAGFILSLGMAVDANVLIFERLKEELQSGRDLKTAIDEGFRRAWTSIRDGNITTLIAAGVLFMMATSFVKGFALTLGIGILTSMITAIFVTRIFLKWASERKLLRAKWLYNGTK